MKILFVSRLFHNISGGVERMSVMMMNEMIRRGHSVELLSWDRQGASMHYPLSEKVVWHCLDMGDAMQKAGFRMRWQRQMAIRRLIARMRPDVVIAFQDGPFLTTAVAMLGLGIPIIAAERNAPQRYDHLSVRKWKALIFQRFRLATRITVQFDAYTKGYPAYLRDRIVAIPNPVQPAETGAQPEGQEGAEKRLLCVGRLCYQKNQAVLIEAFARVAPQFTSWRLVFVGDGEDEAVLKEQTMRLGVQAQVSFVPATKNIDVFYQDAHLFCLPARWEGFPNVLAEAMAHGLPVIGFAGCEGVNHLIQDGTNGVLAAGNGNVESLTRALILLMSDRHERTRLGRAAAASMAAYAPSAVFDKWESLFMEMADAA